MEYNIDNEVINSEVTFKDIAHRLKKNESVLIGWTDEVLVHYDILFTYKNIHVANQNNIQGRIKGSYLFISVMRKGAFAFKVEPTTIDYISEKLFVNDRKTLEKLTELINGVITNLK